MFEMGSTVILLFEKGKSRLGSEAGAGRAAAAGRADREAPVSKYSSVKG